jgi:serine/threonine protein phosphatase 1
LQRTIAIGDIHGCLAALRAVIAAIEPSADDTIVTLGDYVDRGHDSPGVLDEMLALEKGCLLVPLMGNHEQMMLEAIAEPDAVEIWKEFGGASTLRNYDRLVENIPDEHRSFISRCRRYYEMATHFLCTPITMPTCRWRSKLTARYSGKA